MESELQQLLDLLVAEGKLQADQTKAKQSMLEDSERQKGIARTLVELLGMSEGAVVEAICKGFGLARMKIASEIETAPPNILTEEEILRYRALPVFLVGLELTVAFIDPPSGSVRSDLQKISSCRILPVVTTISDFESALQKYGGALDKLQRLGSTLDLSKFDIRKRDSKGSGSKADLETESSIAKLVD